MSNAASAQTCETRALKLCLIKLTELNDTSSIPKGNILILSDSAYMVEGVNTHLKFWSQNNYIKTDGKPLKHREEWEIIDECLSKLRRVEVKKVSAHKKVRVKEKADSIAKAFATSNWRTNSL